MSISQELREQCGLEGKQQRQEHRLDQPALVLARPWQASRPRRNPVCTVAGPCRRVLFQRVCSEAGFQVTDTALEKTAMGFSWRRLGHV